MLKLQNDTSVVSVLNEIAKQINENPQIDKEQIIKLFSSDGFKSMIKDSLMQKWMITPQEVAQKAKMDSLYNGVKDQIEKLEHVIKENGATGSSITTTANLIKSNVEFMNYMFQYCENFNGDLSKCKIATNYSNHRINFRLSEETKKMLNYDVNSPLFLMY